MKFSGEIENPGERKKKKTAKLVPVWCVLSGHTGHAAIIQHRQLRQMGGKEGSQTDISQLQSQQGYATQWADQLYMYTCAGSQLRYMKRVGQNLILNF